jgi:hypothetical protein
VVDVVVGVIVVLVVVGETVVVVVVKLGLPITTVPPILQQFGKTADNKENIVLNKGSPLSIPKQG